MHRPLCLPSRFATLLLAALAPLALAASAAARTQAVEVRVLAADGAPLEAAAVTVAAEGGAFRHQAASDAQGRVRVELPEARGSYRFHVEHPQHKAFEELVDLDKQKSSAGDLLTLEVKLLAVDAVDWFNRGVERLRTADTAGAEAAFRRAVELDPELARGWSVLALVLVEAGKPADALAAADRALALSAGETDALRARYDALAALGRADEADAALGELVARDPSPELARLLFNAGATAANAGQSERAKLRLEQALARQPGLWQAHAALAELEVRANRLDDALAALDRALAVAPEQARLWDRKATVLRALGRTDEAAAADAEAAKRRAPAGGR